MKFKQIKIIVFTILFFLIIFVFEKKIYAEKKVNFETAFELYQNKLYFLAHRKFEEIIKLSLSDVDIEKSYYYSALSSFYLKQYKRAVAEFRRLLLNFPESLFKENAKFFISLSYFYSKRYVAAIQNFREFLKEYPSSNLKLKSLFYIGKAYFELQYIDNALKSLTEIVDKYPNNRMIPMVEFEIAKIYFYNKQYKNAIMKFKKILKKYHGFKNPDEINLWIAECYKNIGNIDKSLASYNEIYNTSIISLYRKLALFNIAVINFQINNFTESKKYFLEFLEKYSSDTDLLDDCYYFLARIFFENKEYSLAQKYLDLLVENFKKSPWLENSFLLYGKMLLDKKKYMDAIKFFKKGLEISQYRKDLFLKNIADIYLKNYYYDEAKLALTRLIKETSSSGFLMEAYYNLGNIYLKENKKDNALNLFLKIHKQFLRNDIFLYSTFKIGKIFYERKNYAESLKYFKELVESNIDKKVFLKNKVNYYITKIYFEEKRYKDTLQYLQKWFGKEVKEKREELLWIKAQCMYFIGEKDKAKNLFRIIVWRYPESKYALKSIERLIDDATEKDDFKFILTNLKTITKFHKLSEPYSKKVLKLMSKMQDEKD